MDERVQRTCGRGQRTQGDGTDGRDGTNGCGGRKRAVKTNERWTGTVAGLGQDGHNGVRIGRAGLGQNGHDGAWIGRMTLGQDGRDGTPTGRETMDRAGMVARWTDALGEDLECNSWSNRERFRLGFRQRLAHFWL